MTQQQTPGQIGYQHYAEQTGGKTWDGRDMPTWDQLPENIQAAWNAAASGIAGHLHGQAQRHLDRIERSANVMNGAALVRDLDTITDHNVQIGQALEALDSLLAP